MAATDRRAALLYFAVGTAAIIAGVATTTWRGRRRGTEDAAAVSALFGQTLTDADGTPQSLAQWRGTPVIVNFWATWCEPCVREMPDLQRLRDAYASRGLQVLGLAIDQPARIRSFRDQLQLTVPLFAAAAAGSDLMRALGNASDALPYTVLISRTGSVLWRHLGQIDPELLRKELDAAVAP